MTHITLITAASQLSNSIITGTKQVHRRYTVIHGECLDVGIGGYLAGGGINVGGSSSKVSKTWPKLYGCFLPSRAGHLQPFSVVSIMKNVDFCTS